ncbi:hypothetical protein MMC22_006130 [Lobaria immixta]|nr:hypothetical protein [Lobaria immixta]
MECTRKAVALCTYGRNSSLFLLNDLSPSNIRQQDVFREYKGIREGSSESVEDLINRIKILEEQMPPQPELTRIHTLLLAHHLGMQETILKRQESFDTQNELQKLAVELEAFESKTDRRRDQGGSNPHGNAAANKKKGRPPVPT